MEFIKNIETLEALYGTPAAPSLRKVARHLTPLYRKWIMAARLCILSTVGPEGVDGSPRGDDGPVVLELDRNTLAMPDWRGNNRLDSLRNIVRDPRVSLMFMVPGSNSVVRLNGTAHVTDDQDLRARFEKNGKTPATVIVIEIAEIYTQCARALMRACTWVSADETTDLPTVGEILAEASDGEEGGTQYDLEWGARRAAKTMW
ncbi:pyridoxamine 5'-phosphate oxidase family protein [Ruegeria atlantica]|uniref:pyridoxamine 5'-phosphate oxidase family protein n=1 Tax=Ruegeria atlantica TaxID=81569 RepID=UPI001479AE93|nr:pyridoxamine 5'-phosphate oxidase family protein [Ruegeria atlantica]